MRILFSFAARYYDSVFSCDLCINAIILAVKLLPALHLCDLTKFKQCHLLKSQM